jgi:predicted nucleotidyltransferase
MTEQRQTQRTVVREPASLGYPALAEIVRRVVDAAHPDSIILFGSAARGETGPDSDLDLLVVKTGVSHDNSTVIGPALREGIVIYAA